MINKHFNTLLASIEKIAKQEDTETALKKTTLLLKENVEHYNWVGFYIMNFKKNVLELGPYTGAPTDHTEIAPGKGVCGQVAESRKTKIVQDVSKEDNYLACSLNVQSEIVVPILRDGKFIAEIDIDSHAKAPFTSVDQEFLAEVARILEPLF
jgi:L-methionine (R)-S-oxide reductase